MNRGIVQPDVQQVRNLVLIIMFPKLFLRTVRKNCLSDEEELMKFEAEGREFAKFEITRTVKKSEQFLATECFFKLFLQVSLI